MRETVNDIHYDSGELMRNIEASLERLTRICFSDRNREALGKQFLFNVEAWEKKIGDRKNDPFTIVVCGEFKRGKSSFINAFVGEDVMPVDVTPETVTMNRLCYGPSSNEAVLSGGRRLTLSDQDLKRERLKEILSGLQEPVIQLEIRRPIDILQGIAIIDTPGLNDDNQTADKVVSVALKRADAFIYLYSIQYPLSQTEQLFLRSCILPQETVNLFIVGNYADVIQPDDRIRIQNMLNQRTEGLLPGCRSILVSALDERCRQMNTARPNSTLTPWLEENFRLLRDRIDTMLREKKDTVLPVRMEHLLKGMTIQLNSELGAMELGLNEDAEQVARQMQVLQNETGELVQLQKDRAEALQKRISVMKAQTKAWIHEVLQEMQSDLDTLSGVSLEDIDKFYTFFCIDTLQNALQLCYHLHIGQLLESMGNLSPQVLEGGALPAPSFESDFQFTTNNMIWTAGDNVSFVVTQLSAPSLLQLVVQGITGALRGKSIKKKTPEIIDSIRAYYPKFEENANQTIDAAYEQLAEYIQKLTESYFKARKDAVDQRLTQMMRVTRQDEAHRESIRNAISEVRGILSNITLENG